MDIRYAMHPDQMKGLDTDEIRRHFLIDRLFEKDEMNLIYSHIDRIIVGGACPTDKKLELKVTKELGVDSFLQRREMGIINIGSKGIVSLMAKNIFWRRKSASMSAWALRRSHSKVWIKITRPNSILTALRLIRLILSLSFQ